jgi:uncharacterized membrane protein YphA (DoxX/SURF4 family)
MSLVNRILTYALGLFLISSGITKFVGGHVFQYIEYQSGLDAFYPYVNHATGIAEVLAGGFILFGATRLAGGAMAAGIMVGAVGFHLSPWLGVSIPTGLAEEASAPWTAGDFAETTSPMSFVLAITAAAWSITILRNELLARRTPSRTASGIRDNERVAV